MSAALQAPEGSIGDHVRVNFLKADITETTQSAVTATVAPSPSVAPSPTAVPAAIAPAVPVAATAVTITVTVVHDGQTRTVPTNAPTVGVLLQEMGIGVGASDKLSPPASSGLSPGATVRIIRVHQTTTKQEIVVAFTVSTQNTNKLEVGKQSVQPGVNGQTEQVLQQTFEDAKLVASVVVSSKVIHAMQPQVTLVGTAPHAYKNKLSGAASWYDAPGNGMTAASPDLPFGTVVHVTDLGNGRTVDVTIADRGPYAGGRVLDLSRLAFGQLESTNAGIINVKMQW